MDLFARLASLTRSSEFIGNDEQLRVSIESHREGSTGVGGPPIVSPAFLAALGAINSGEGSAAIEPERSPSAADIERAEGGGAQRPHSAPSPGTPAPAEAEAAELELASEAERHRLTTQLSSIDVRTAARLIENAVPFVVLLSVVFVFNHFREMALVGWGMLVLHRANGIVRLQVSRKASLNRGPLLSTLAILACNCAAITVLGPGRRAAGILLLAGVAGAGEFWDVLFTVATADLALRYALAACKVAVLLLHPANSPQRLRRRAGLLTAMDYSVAVHRGLIPVPLWCRYFTSAGLTPLLSLSLCGLYLIFKLVNVIDRVSLAALALRQWRGSAHGAAPTQEELAAAPPECSVCQEALRSPIRLACGHVYCEDCIGEWLEREATCPMCRSEVRRATLRPLGDGATTLIPILC